jgi:hypothetical protein
MIYLLSKIMDLHNFYHLLAIAQSYRLEYHLFNLVFDYFLSRLSPTQSDSQEDCFAKRL